LLVVKVESRHESVCQSVIVVFMLSLCSLRTLLLSSMIFPCCWVIFNPVVVVGDVAASSSSSIVSLVKAVAGLELEPGAKGRDCRLALAQQDLRPVAAAAVAVGCPIPLDDGERKLVPAAGGDVSNVPEAGRAFTKLEQSVLKIAKKFKSSS
jgi:hypothetical protein